MDIFPDRRKIFRKLGPEHAGYNRTCFTTHVDGQNNESVKLIEAEYFGLGSDI